MASKHNTQPSDSNSIAASKLRRLIKTRRLDVQRLRVHLRAKHYLTRCGPSTPFTLYSFVVADDARSQPSHNRKSTDWRFAKRFSECYDMRLQLACQAQRWERAHSTAERTTDACVAVAAALRRPTQLTFPRRHLRCDSDAIVRARCVGLYDFVRCLLAVYADIYAHLFAARPTTAAATDPIASAGCTNSSTPTALTILWRVYTDIAAFLCVPTHRREAEHRHAAAIFALEDCGHAAPKQRVLASSELADALASSEHDSTDDDDDDDFACCICLDDDDGTHNEDSEQCSSSGPHSSNIALVKQRLSVQQQLVQLPCGHAFHEDCVISWFDASTTCPLCRQPIAATLL